MYKLLTIIIILKQHVNDIPLLLLVSFALDVLLLDLSVNRKTDSHS